MKRYAFLVVLGSWQAVAAQQPPATAIDAVFERWTSPTPGCAVGVGVGGTPVLERKLRIACGWR